MIKRIFITIFACALSVFYLTAMDNKTEAMITVIKDGQETLVPLVKIIQEHVQNQSSESLLNQPSGIFQSTCNFIAAHPQGILEFVGYTAFLGSIVYFVNSKRCFVTPSAHSRLEAAENAQKEKINQQFLDISTDAQAQSAKFTLKSAQERYNNNKKKLSSIMSLRKDLNSNFEVMMDEFNTANALLRKKQRKEFVLLIKRINESYQNDEQQFTKGAQEVRQHLGASFESLSTHSKIAQSAVTVSMDNFFETVQTDQVSIHRYNIDTSSQLERLQLNLGEIETTLGLFKEAKTKKLDLKSFKKLNHHVEQQRKYLEQMEQWLDQNSNNTTELVIPEYEN